MTDTNLTREEQSALIDRINEIREGELKRNPSIHPKHLSDMLSAVQSTLLDDKKRLAELVRERNNSQNTGRGM